MTIHYKRNALILAITAILIGVASWQIYSLINLIAKDLLEMQGITNEYVKGIIILATIIAILGTIGFGFRKTFKKVIGMK
jgi:hypothetical protein